MKQHHNDLLEVTKTIEARWRQVENQTELFPEIVREVTTGCDFRAFGDLSRTPELLEIPGVAAIQKPTSFSDLHIELFNNGRFQVEVLNWWDGDINIHDHDFSGIQFQLTGESLNVGYIFDGDGTGAKVSFGELRVVDAGIWRPGDRSYVHPGRRGPHTVNHLSLPTVSMVIRTSPDPGLGPQRNYFPPFLSASYGVADTVFRKKVGALRHLARGPVQDFEHAFRRIMAHQTTTECLFTLLKTIDIVFRGEHTRLLREYAESSPLAQSVVLSAAYYRATQIIMQTVIALPRSTPEQRLAAAILASSWDHDSSRAVQGHLSEQGVHVDMHRALVEIHDALADHQRSPFKGALELLGNGSLLDRAA